MHLRPACSGEINLLRSLPVRNHQRQFITADPTRGGERGPPVTRRSTVLPGGCPALEEVTACPF
ncbi:hypothetical protein BZL30_2356 [Mycobacterium kansasii]|uniref:Uncharacterized protein n=1 Tax=Mycobacterium kansasii TaxID=1768 RepID=A0A1V3XI02_MYCKA|nr:hypothetical protein BZL30_2356 [Mycobacterium kansasii]